MMSNSAKPWPLSVPLMMKRELPFGTTSTNSSRMSISLWNIF